MGSFRPITGRFNHDCSQPLRARWTLAAPSTMDAAATGCSVLDLFDATSDAAALRAPHGQPISFRQLVDFARGLDL